MYLNESDGSIVDESIPVETKEEVRTLGVEPIKNILSVSRIAIWRDDGQRVLSHIYTAGAKQ